MVIGGAAVVHVSTSKPTCKNTLNFTMEFSTSIKDLNNGNRRSSNRTNDVC